MKIDILGVKIDNLRFNDVLEQVVGMVAEGGAHYIVTPYAESIVRAQTDLEFREILNRADLAVPDGVSLLMAAKYLAKSSAQPLDGLKPKWLYCLVEGVKVGLSVIANRRYLDVIPETVKGTDLMVALFDLADRKGWKVLLLGGWFGVGEEIAVKVRKHHHRLTIEVLEGCHTAENESMGDWEKIKSRLAEFRPDLLFVAYGPVIQEKWITKHLRELSSGVVIGVAGAFDMVSGRKKRAPSLLRNIGLEWLWRLVIEPTRFRRILTAFPYFPWLVFKKSLEI